MAEGFVNALYGERYRAFSAGTEPSSLNAYAVRVMQEIGIDISDHRSKSVDEFMDQDLDYVVTVCDHAKESCPFFPGGQRPMHKGFLNPASVAGPEEQKLAVFPATLSHPGPQCQDFLGGLHFAMLVDWENSSLM